MASMMCPCSSCFAATREYPALVQQQQHQHRHYYLQPNLNYFREKKQKVFGRLRRVQSIESTTSTLVGLTTAAQPMAVSEKEKEHL